MFKLSTSKMPVTVKKNNRSTVSFEKNVNCKHSKKCVKSPDKVTTRINKLNKNQDKKKSKQIVSKAVNFRRKLHLF